MLPEVDGRTLFLSERVRGGYPLTILEHPGNQPVDDQGLAVPEVIRVLEGEKG